MFVQSPYPAAMVQHMRRAGIEPTLAEWQAALCGSQRDESALDELPDTLGDELRAIVERLVAEDEDAGVRAGACQALANRLADDAVPVLLEALRDADAEVRGAATEALERIRFHQEQRAYWQRARAGIDTSPANAAALLIAQAQPDQDQEQRLLAIRSLALLDTPEALPYLIGWTKDADAAVARAAREAIATIHARGRTPR